jgi:CRISPR-associated protein Cmr3
MTTWIIEPRDPLIVRDGRPFGLDPGGHTTSLPFPFPSTIAGGTRARAALSAEGIFDFDSPQQIDDLKKMRIRGPLLVQLTDDGHDIAERKWLVPTPGDVLLLEGKPIANDRAVLMQQLLPLQLPKDAHTDFNRKNLWIVGQPFAHYAKKKPMKKLPSFWYWETFQTWLFNPAQLHDREMPLSVLGLEQLQHNQRLHVSIDADREAAKDGMLFGTSGLEFTLPGRGEQRLLNARRLALAVAVDNDTTNHHTAFTLRTGLAGLAGERRIVAWRKSNMDLPPCPDELVQAIIANTACRIILLTPAIFEQGYYPTRLQTEARKYGVNVDIQAIAIQRSQVVSGWDLYFKKPKPSRYLAPAGTVLFLSLQGSDDAISQWIRGMWMQCISDDEQDCRDGFGLAVVGTWSGQPVAME